MLNEAVCLELVHRNVASSVKVPKLSKRVLLSLRSTWASVALEAGVPVKSVSERLGHKNIHQTLQTYVQTDERVKVPRWMWACCTVFSRLEQWQSVAENWRIL